MARLKFVFLFVCILFGMYQVESSEIWDTIKGGFDVAYQKTHCGLHKVKEFVKHHEHDVDPCAGELTVTEKPEVNAGFTENPHISNDGEQPTATNTYGWRV